MVDVPIERLNGELAKQILVYFLSLYHSFTFGLQIVDFIDRSMNLFG